MMNDNVNHPAHYTDGKYEVIDFIEQYKLPFHLANTVKYICRAGKKNPATKIEDLKKALWYLNRFHGDIKSYVVYANAMKFMLRDTDWNGENSVFHPSIDPKDFAKDKQLSSRMEYVICSIAQWCGFIESGEDIMGYCELASDILMFEEEIEELEAEKENEE